MSTSHEVWMRKSKNIIENGASKPSGTTLLPEVKK
jgi:hypothetical protein